MIAARRFLPGGRYLYAGPRLHQTQNCLAARSMGDSREGFGAIRNEVRHGAFNRRRHRHGLQRYQAKGRLYAARVALQAVLST